MITFAIIILAIIGGYLTLSAKSAGANIGMTVLTLACIIAAIWSVLT